LILRDSLAILSLLLATAALLVVTLLLFHSFSAHRADLARRWSERGQAALKAGKPDEAISALRTALIYAPGERDYELLLAQALGQTGRPEQSEESYQYFISLWGVEPGNGAINLALARLARNRQQRQDAVNFYRAAIYGTWEGDGAERRAAARLELAQYLIEGGDLSSAQMELLIVGGNAPDDYSRDMEVAGLLEQTGDDTDAATYYQRALRARPGDNAAEQSIARIEAARTAAAAAAAAHASTAAAEPDSGSQHLEEK
jgi:Tfp pilus assembly protein PilF